MEEELAALKQQLARDQEDAESGCSSPEIANTDAVHAASLRRGGFLHADSAILKQSSS